MTPIAPIFAGTVDRFSISPSLMNGLTIDPLTGFKLQKLKKKKN